MAKKTNKTSHVMDLLTNGSSEEAVEPVSEAASFSQDKKSDVQSHTVTPAKVTVVDEGSRNDRLSQEILGKLTEELEAEQGQSMKEMAIPDDMAEELESDMAVDEEQDSLSELSQNDSETLEPNNEKITEHAQDSFSDNFDSETIETLENEEGISNIEQSQDTPQDSFTAENAKQQETVENTSESEVVHGPFKKEMRSIFPQNSFVTHAQDNAYQFLNVMEQVLMRQDLESILKKHGVCTCPRCMSDVCALVLTRLPSKYVVTDKDSISPLISYYENKHKVQILAQLMMACDKVRERPRHKKE